MVAHEYVAVSGTGGRSRPEVWHGRARWGSIPEPKQNTEQRACGTESLNFVYEAPEGNISSTYVVTALVFLLSIFPSLVSSQYTQISALKSLLFALSAPCSLLYSPFFLTYAL